MNYGYARVSTVKQSKGTSLEDQEQELKKAGAEIILKDSCSGTKMNRPEFTKLMGQIKSGDKLIVTKLDRFARTAVEGGAIVKKLHEMGVTIHILNMGVADNTPMGKLMVTMLLAFAELYKATIYRQVMFAEFERDMIVERTQTGRAHYREECKRTGKPLADRRPRKFTDTQLNTALKAIESGMSYTKAEKEYKISKSTLIRAKRDLKAKEMEEDM